MEGLFSHTAVGQSWTQTSFPLNPDKDQDTNNRSVSNEALGPVKEAGHYAEIIHERYQGPLIMQKDLHP